MVLERSLDPYKKFTVVSWVPSGNLKGKDCEQGPWPGSVLLVAQGTVSPQVPDNGRR